MVKIVYHGSPQLFRRFTHKTKGIRTKHSPADVGFHFTNRKDEAYTYSALSTKEFDYFASLVFGRFSNGYKEINPTLYKVAITMSKPLVFKKWVAVDAKMIKQAKKRGYDSIIISKIKGEKEYVVFKVNQIKILDTQALFSEKKIIAKWKREGSPKY